MSGSHFARDEVYYQDRRIGEIAGWCRVWTEGMFVPIYKARMKARTSDNPKLDILSRRACDRYRDATFALLVAVDHMSLGEAAFNVRRHYQGDSDR